MCLPCSRCVSRAHLRTIGKFGTDRKISSDSGSETGMQRSSELSSFLDTPLSGRQAAVRFRSVCRYQEWYRQTRGRNFMWKRRKFDGGSDLEAQLRSYRASAPEELVDRVGHRIAGERRAPQRAWSRVAFASAVAVFMLGTFASFGGLSYAASGA